MVYRIASRGFQTFILVFLAALAVGFMTIDDWIFRAIGVLIGVLALSAAFFLETHIDARNGHIIRTARLFGIIRTWRREWPSSEFSGIQCLCSTKANVGDGDISDTWVVSLQPRSGRAIWVRQFSLRTGEGCLEARRFARELSQLTGLQITDHEVQPAACS